MSCTITTEADSPLAVWGAAEASIGVETMVCAENSVARLDDAPEEASTVDVPGVGVAPELGVGGADGVLVGGGPTAAGGEFGAGGGVLAPETLGAG